MDRGHRLPLTRHARLLGVSRASLLSERDLAMMRRIDELHLERPFPGGRLLPDMLRREGQAIGQRYVASVMRRMGIKAIYRRRNTSCPHAEHPIYPYLLRHLVIERPTQVWAADITYVPMAKGQGPRASST